MKNLRLRQERYQQSRPTSAFAGVLVDTGVFHLDELFDYRIPHDLSEQVRIGSRVQVTFHGIKREGIVYEIRDTESITGRILSIEKVLGDIPLVSQTTIELVDHVAQRWAGTRYDIWRSALPPRTITSERNLVSLPPSQSEGPAIRKPQHSLTYLMLPPFQRAPDLLAKAAAPFLRLGNVLLVMPDEKDVDLFIRYSRISNIINISSSLTKAERYRNYLLAQGAMGNIVIGNRSAIFANLPKLSAIIVHREISENHYELRSPGWNTRDVALIRHSLEKVPLIFTGYGASSEMALEIDTGRIAAPVPRRRIALMSTASSQGELIPSKLLPRIRAALRRGSILFLAPRKGYASGLICARCRNVLHHHCGGVLERTSINGPMRCSACDDVLNSAQCHWCKGETFHITGRGSARVLEEIGKAFPSVPIRESTGENLLTELGDFQGIVVATSGAAPISSQGYAGVFILEGERFLAGIDMRSTERSTESFFATCALAEESGEIGLTLPGENPLVTALMKWNPAVIATRMLSERQSAQLPPYQRVIEIIPPQSEISTIETGLRKALSDGRLPSSLRIFVLGEKIRLLVLPRESVGAIDFIYQFQRKRSVSGKKLLSIRIDPYSLN